MKPGNLIVIIVLLLIVFAGCSGKVSEPISPGNPTPYTESYIPDTDPYSNSDNFSSLGIAGIYNLKIEQGTCGFELTPRRLSSLGESFIVSGKSYFAIFPCTDCLKIKSVGLDASEDIAVNFLVSHPFNKGNTSLPPSGKNRLDLDVFDLALMIEPSDKAPTHYPLTDADIHTDVIRNPEGYSGDLGDIMPYTICYESSSNNRFEMGTKDHEFIITLCKPGLNFNIYLTMGYGSSATFNERLSPVYFIPEFNRKAAWKIDVTAPVWDSQGPETVTIDIYDWNHGATVSSNFPDVTNTNHISASSDISSVTVEVPGMTNAVVAAETVDTTTNGWDDPLTYTATFANENNLTDGEYVGLVKVLDSRTPGGASQSDSLVISPDGKTLEYHELAEFAAYQTFPAVVSTTHWVRTWGGDSWDMTDCAYVDSNGFIYIAGDFSTTADFDPGPGEDIHNAHGIWPDAFVAKMDSDGNYVWGKSWGLSAWDSSVEVVTDTSGNVYVAGFFQSMVDFDPGSGSYYETSNGAEDVFVLKLDPDGNFIHVLTWGGFGSDIPYDIILNGSNLYITGFFSRTVDFDCTSGEDEFTSVDNSEDVFLTIYDTGGNYQWTKTWGDSGWDMGFAVNIGESNNIYTVGSFEGTVDFDPGSGDDFHTGVVFDAFISKLTQNGDFIWARTWGADDWDEAYDVIYDGSQFLYLTGIFTGDVDFDPGLDEDWHTGINEDPYLCKYNCSGDFIWAVTWGGGLAQSGNAMALDSNGNILITGDFEARVDFDPGPDVVQIDSHGSNDIYLSKFDTDGNFQWVYTWGATDSDGGWGVDIDDQDHVIVTGAFREDVDFNLGFGEDIRTSNGDYDCYVMKFLIN
jgi:hypothetical protein